MKKNKITLTLSLIGDLSVAVNDDVQPFTWYLDIENEEVIPYPLEGTDKDEVERIESRLDDFIKIPPALRREKWEELRDFIDELDVNNNVKALLRTNIKGSGAFRRFKDALAQIGELDTWYAYQNRLNCQKALQWLIDEDLIDEEGYKNGMKLYDDSVLKQKKREEEIRGMVTGTIVECIENIGHVGKISIGARYRVKAKRPQHLIIQLKNDVDQLKWYPKSHFKLAEEDE